MVRPASTKPRSDADKVTELLAEEARYCRELADEYEDGGFDAGATTASPTRTRDGARRWPKVEDALERFQPAGQVRGQDVNYFRLRCTRW